MIMAYDPNFRPNYRYGAQMSAPGWAGDIDAGLRAFMVRVYGYMAGGLALTGIVAYAAASSGFYASIAGTPLIWLVMLAPLGFVLVLSFGIDRISAEVAQVLFWAYAAVMGLSLAGIFLVFTGASIARVFFISAALLSAPLPAFFARSRAHRPASLKDDPIPRTCYECSGALPVRPRKFYSEECNTPYYSDIQFRAIVAAIAPRRADPKRSRAANLAIGKKASCRTARSR
jgi:hypothetical protein